MALLDKVRKTLSSIGQKVDQNQSNPGIQLLPPISINRPNIQPVKQFFTPKTGTLATAGRQFAQNIASRPLTLTQQRVAEVPIGAMRGVTSALTGFTGLENKIAPKLGLGTFTGIKPQYTPGKVAEVAGAIGGSLIPQAPINQLARLIKPVGAVRTAQKYLGSQAGKLIAQKGLTGLAGRGIANVSQGIPFTAGFALAQKIGGHEYGGKQLAGDVGFDVATGALVPGAAAAIPLLAGITKNKADLGKFLKHEAGVTALVKRMNNLDKMGTSGYTQTKEMVQKAIDVLAPDLAKNRELNKLKDGINADEWMKTVTNVLQDRLVAAKTGDYSLAGMSTRSLKKLDAPKLSVEPTTSIDKVSQSATKYGWTAKQGEKGIELFNRNGKKVVDLKEKSGGRYEFTYPDGEKLMSGRGQIGESTERLIRDAFYGKLEPSKPLSVEPTGGNLQQKKSEFQALVSKMETEKARLNKIDPNRQVTTMGDNLLDSKDYNRMQELGGEIARLEDSARGINSTTDIKEIVQLKRSLRQKGIPFNEKASKQELQSLLSPSKPLSVEPTGGKDSTAQARNQGGIGDINDVKSRLLNVFTFSESEKLAIRKAQTPEELAPYLRKLNDGSLAKFFNSGAGTVEHPNQPKPLSVEPVGGEVKTITPIRKPLKEVYKEQLTKGVDTLQPSKQLENIQPVPKALDNLGIPTTPQPEPQKAQTLRNLKQESVPLDNIISEAKKQIGTTPEPKDKNVKQVMDGLYTQWVSRYNPIEEASRRAKKTLKTKGAELRPEFDPEYLVRRLTGAGGIADQRFKTELNPIIKEMESLNIPKSDMDVYLANKRIAGFGKAGRDIYGADPKKAQEVVAAIENKYGNIQGLAQKFYDYQNKGFQEMVDAGFISPESAKTIKSQNPDYAPLYRVMDEMDEYLGLPTRKTMQGTQPISKLKGSTRQIESPVESIIGNTFKQRAAIEKNRVAQSIVGLQNIADMGFTKAAKASPETITVWNNGKKEYWNVGKDIAETAKGQNEEQMNLLLKVLQAPASLLRQGATGRNPEFLLPNIIRDQLDAGITSKYGYIPFVDFTSGLISMAKNDDVYKKWANSGAKIDLGEISGKKSIQELFNSKVEKKKLSTWLSQGLDALGTLSEQPTRVGLFKKAYKKTGNELLAMMESRDATVDFARMGSKMKVANSIIPFLNVGVQGFDKLIRAVKNNPGRVALNAGIYGALPAIMTTLYNLNKDPEAYAEIPQYEKDSNFILVIGRNKNGTVDYLTFPKGNVIPTIANPIESFLAFTKNEDPEAFKQMLTQTLTSTLPVVGDGATAGEVATKTIGGLIPQGIKPLAENLLNKSFYKYDPKKEQSKEIVPYYMQNKPAYQQTYDFTPQMYQKIGAVFNASPLKVKNLMEGYLAGYTKIPSQIVEMMYKTSRGEEISPNEKTLMRRFIKQTYPNSGKEPEVKPEVPGLMERVTGKAGAAETAPVKEIKYKRASDNSSQTIKLSDLQKPTGTTLKDYLSSGDRDATIREIYKAYAKGEIDQSTMNKAFSGAGVSVREAENLVIATLPTEQKATLVHDRLVSPQSQLKDLEELVSSKLLTTAVIKEMKDTGKINDQQESALKNYLKQKTGKVSKGKKPKKFKPTKFKAIKLKGAKKTYLKQKKLTLKDLLRK